MLGCLPTTDLGVMKGCLSFREYKAQGLGFRVSGAGFKVYGAYRKNGLTKKVAEVNTSFNLNSILPIPQL